MDTHEDSVKLAEKIAADGKGGLRFPLLSDPGHRVIDSYGLHDPAYDKMESAGIPHPAVYVVDRKRRVVWSKVEPDYRKRPANEDIRAALKSMK